KPDTYVAGSGVAKEGTNGQLPISLGDLPIVIFINSNSIN
ncbi:unnamed protein product, partial [Rotaria magnacalcarata]